MATKKKAKRGRASVSAKKYRELEVELLHVQDAFRWVCEQLRFLNAERDVLAEENVKLRRKLGRLEGKGSRKPRPHHAGS